MAYETILQEDDGPVATIIMNRPHMHNALSVEVFRELTACLIAISKDPDIRVVVIKGAGDKAFVAGADIKEMAAAEGAETGSERSYLGMHLYDQIRH
ncbi:MAG: enoyl-CoA hydratase/isomerase family protein, partial [Rhodospirillaceae bacterium]|nr:enoyl-CoA hydratase/isomerase family protein [Rhodospirillaceae bacterium]